MDQLWGSARATASCAAASIAGCERPLYRNLTRTLCALESWPLATLSAPGTVASLVRASGLAYTRVVQPRTNTSIYGDESRWMLARHHGGKNGLWQVPAQLECVLSQLSTRQIQHSLTIGTFSGWTDIFLAAFLRRQHTASNLNGRSLRHRHRPSRCQFARRSPRAPRRCAGFAPSPHDVTHLTVDVITATVQRCVQESLRHLNVSRLVLGDPPSANQPTDVGLMRSHRGFRTRDGRRASSRALQSADRTTRPHCAQVGGRADLAPTVQSCARGARCATSPPLATRSATATAATAS